MKVKTEYKLDPLKEDHLGLYDSPVRRFLSRKRLKAIRESVDSVKDAKSVLELGCGHGEVLEAIYEPDVEYLGIEINPNSVELAKERFKGKSNITIIAGDIRKLENLTDKFDVVICTEVIEHIPDPREVLLEIKRVLKPDGTFVSTVPFEYLLVFLRLLILPLRLLQKKGIFINAHLHYFTKRSYRKLLEQYFDVEKIERVEYLIRFLAVCKNNG